VKYAETLTKEGPQARINQPATGSNLGEKEVIKFRSGHRALAARLAIP